MQKLHSSTVALTHHLWPHPSYVAHAKRGERAIVDPQRRASQTESIMDPRRTQEQIGLFQIATPDSRSREIDAIRAAAMRARDEAIAAGLRRLFAGLGRGLAAIGTALVSWPERRQTYENLRGLTDRELADIGLARGDISRVFEPGFRLPARKAVDATQAGLPATPRAA
jgi:uncharacterized protein YjiS (DUF1127 family)